MNGRGESLATATAPAPRLTSAQFGEKFQEFRARTGHWCPGQMKLCPRTFASMINGQVALAWRELKLLDFF